MRVASTWKTCTLLVSRAPPRKLAFSLVSSRKRTTATIVRLETIQQNKLNKMKLIIFIILTAIRLTKIILGTGCMNSILT